MKLGIVGCFPIEPRRRCCGLRALFSAPKPQLTYGFFFNGWFLLYFNFFKFINIHWVNGQRDKMGFTPINKAVSQKE
jgi:hypothetical protein